MEENDKKQSRFSIKNLIIAVLVLVVIGSGVFFYFYERSKYIWTNDAQIEGYYVNVAPDIMARIITLDVEEGDFVYKGQRISRLDDSILLSEQQRAKAHVQAEEDRTQVKKAHFDKIKGDYERARRAIRDHIISPQEFDHREKEYLMAEAEYKQSLSQLQLAHRQVEVIDSRLAHTVLWAPRNGFITKRWALEGDVMDVGQTIFSLYDLDNIWVLARLDETKIGQINIGDRVRIYVDAYPDYTFEGRVYVVKSAAASQFMLVPQDNATGNYTKVQQRVPLKISIEKPHNFPSDRPLYLLPGMSVEVYIQRGSA